MLLLLLLLLLLISIDNNAITDTTTVEDVRNMLRGEPGTEVKIEFERDFALFHSSP